MDLQACTEAIRAKVGDDSGLNATLKFDCGDEGVVFVDALVTRSWLHHHNFSGKPGSLADWSIESYEWFHDGQT